MAELKISSEEIRDALAQFRDSYDPNATRSEVGAVVEAADGIARVSGLPSVMANELLEFPGGVLGVAQNLDEREIGAVVLGSFELGKYFLFPSAMLSLAALLIRWASLSMVRAQ